MRNVSNETVEKTKTHISCSITSFSFFLENRAVYETMYNNMVESERLRMTIWRMRIACWMPKAANAHSEYVKVLLSHCKIGCKNVP